MLDFYVNTNHLCHNDDFIIKNSSTMVDTVWWLLAIPVGIIVYFIYHFYIRIYVVANKFKKMEPSIKILVNPVFGLLGVQQENLKKYGDSLRYGKEMVKENPDLPAYYTNIGYLPMIILCDAQLIKEFLLSSKKFRKFNLYKHNKLNFKQGLFLAEEELWARQKAIVKHSFNHESMKRMIPAMQISIKDFSNRFLNMIDASPQNAVQFKVLTDTETLIGEILVRIIFSEEAISKKVNGVPLAIALAESTVSIFDRSRTAPNLVFSLFFGENVANINFTKTDIHLYDTIIAIRKIILELLDSRLNNPNYTEKDFIQIYIDQMRENDRLIAEAELKGEAHFIKPITKEEILQQLYSFYFAGIDTTGHLVAFATYCLAEYPNYRLKIEEEIKSIFGNSVQNISYEDLGKMEFTGYFIDEVLRMWPPATGTLARIAKEDIKIGPFSIPKGMLVGTNILGLMHNPKYYHQPQVFNPQRWTEPGAYTKEPYSFIPFSAGPRSCIGKYVALMETKLIIIHFLNKFNFSRNNIPLRVHVKFLYEPFEENLVLLSKGGLQIKG